MGKFDGYLICSDFDGTFSAGADTIDVNSKAVKYFTDNGGKFTFSTGRMASHLRELNLNKIINAPASLGNGGIIYDYESESIISEKRLSYTVDDFLKAISSQLYLDAQMYIFNSCLENAYSLKFCELKELSTSIREMNPIKIACVFSSKNEADNFKTFAMNNLHFLGDYISKSWATSVEFNSADATKGKSIEFLKNYIGNIHTSVGIGDFENDISLISHADIGVAVGNAIDEIKNAADIVVKPADEYAIKDLIEKLEKRM